ALRGLNPRTSRRSGRRRRCLPGRLAARQYNKRGSGPAPCGIRSTGRQRMSERAELRVLRRKTVANLRVNGQERTYDGDPSMPLLWYLRDELGLTGTKF